MWGPEAKPAMIARRLKTGGADSQDVHGNAFQLCAFDPQTRKVVCQRHSPCSRMEFHRVLETSEAPVPAGFGVSIFVLSWAKMTPISQAAVSLYRTKRSRVDREVKPEPRPKLRPATARSLVVLTLGVSPVPRPPIRRWSKSLCIAKFL